MKMKNLAAIAAMLVSSYSHAAPVFVNPGFEAGDLSGWTNARIFSFSLDSSMPHTGSFAGRGGSATVGFARAEQTLSGFVIGNTYGLSVWARNSIQGITGHQAALFVDGGYFNATPLSVTYQQLTYDFVATAATLTVGIGLKTVPGKGLIRFDDISLTDITPPSSVPEPASFWLMAVAGAAALRQRRRA